MPSAGSQDLFLDTSEILSVGGMFVDAVCVDVGNVARYIGTQFDAGRWHGPPSDMPVVPPWPVCFLEVGPSVLELKKPRAVDVYVEVGMLIWATEVDAEHDWRPPIARLWSRLGPAGSGDTPDHWRNFDREVRWLVQFLTFRREGQTVRGPIARGLNLLAEDGTKILFAGTTKPASLAAIPDIDDVIECVDPLDLGAPPLSFPLVDFSWELQERGREIWQMAFALASCANVQIVDEDQQHPSRQARRAAERRGEPPFVKFKTIRIEPKLRRASQPLTEHQKRDLPLHLVRGHFATYTEQKPLFGKYAGRFWVPTHVRGSAEVGLIGKDYEVAPGQDAA